MKETRTVKVTSGKYEAELELTQEQYEDYMRPWWRQKQKAKRNREAIEEKGYTFTSYEEWSCGSGANLSGYGSFEEEVIHKEKLEFLRKVLSTFTEEEKQIALFLRQKETLLLFLERGAISRAQFDKSFGDLCRKMGFEEELTRKDDLQ